MSGADTNWGAAIICDAAGVVQRILASEWAFPDNTVGRLLTTLIHRNCLPQSLDFLAELRRSGLARQSRITVSLADKTRTLDFSGVSSGETMMIMMTPTDKGRLEALDDLLEIQNETVNESRMLLKENSRLIRERSMEVNLLEELSRLNNELTNAQRDLSKKNVELERLNKEKNQFLGIAAHDLRTPLNAIQLYSEFLLDEAQDTLSAEHLDFVATIQDSSRFMLELVNNLLETARIEAGVLGLNLTTVDLTELVRSNVSLNRVLAKKKDIRIELKRVDLPEILLDAPKIQQVMNNLLGNAMKFSPPGTSIRVELSGQGPQAVVTVQDEGPGISKDALGSLFEPFQKAETRPTGGETGTGLGLAIVRSIVKGHGGEVWVNSVVGEGSVFGFSLPLHVMDHLKA